jgi:hypothetical protein
MGSFFRQELETDGWLRALSLADGLNLRVPRPKAIFRPDHGITGELLDHDILIPRRVRAEKAITAATLVINILLLEEGYTWNSRRCDRRIEF